MLQVMLASYCDTNETNNVCYTKKLNPRKVHAVYMYDMHKGGRITSEMALEI